MNMGIGKLRIASVWQWLYITNLRNLQTWRYVLRIGTSMDSLLFLPYLRWSVSAKSSIIVPQEMWRMHRQYVPSFRNPISPGQMDGYIHHPCGVAQYLQQPKGVNCVKRCLLRCLSDFRRRTLWKPFQALFTVFHVLSGTRLAEWKDEAVANVSHCQCLLRRDKSTILLGEPLCLWITTMRWHIVTMTQNASSWRNFS